MHGPLNVKLDTALLIPNLCARRGDGQLHAPSALPPGKNPVSIP
jgi:hypothetical protein